MAAAAVGPFLRRRRNSLGYTPRSSTSFSLCSFRGSCLCACRRTTSGTSSLPIPRPSNSRAIVTRDRSPSPSGSIVPMAIAITGPPTARTAHLLGGLVNMERPAPLSRFVDHPRGGGRSHTQKGAGHDQYRASRPHPPGDGRPQGLHLDRHPAARRVGGRGEDLPRRDLGAPVLGAVP